MSEERIADLLNFINNRMQIGVSGNLIGETKAILEIISALEKALVDNKDIKRDIKKDDKTV